MLRLLFSELNIICFMINIGWWKCDYFKKKNFNIIYMYMIRLNIYSNNCCELYIFIFFFMYKCYNR